MSFQKVFFIGSASLFALIGVVALLKKGGDKDIVVREEPQLAEMAAVEPILPLETKQVKPTTPPSNDKKEAALLMTPLLEEEEMESVNRVCLLFATNHHRLPFVETITYRSRVPWIKGRPAWIADYASHYSTSRHFIARSLNGKPDYNSQEISFGKRFNVFSLNKNIEFYLLIDLSRCKMRFYALDIDTKDRILLKTYPIGLGRFDQDSVSGILTPQGKYRLGEKIAIYKPGMKGFFQDQEIEMIQIFGTRWIPFEDPIDEESEDSRGYGIHGSPWIYDEEKDELYENKACIGKYDSDGCIRLLQEDVEELFSIVITKPTVVKIIKDWTKVVLPGIESKEYPDKEG